MMLLFVVATIFAHISTGNACCSPDQWECDMGIMIASVENNNRSFVEGSQHMVYDAVNKIVALQQYLTINGVYVQQKIISDYGKGQVYIYGDSQPCQTFASEPFEAYCVPDGADGSNLIYGLGVDQVNAMSYQASETGRDRYFIVTADTCVPMAYDQVIKTDNRKVIQVLTFTNVTAGVSDRSVFTVPSSCSTTNIGPILPGLGRRSLMY